MSDAANQLRSVFEKVKRQLTMTEFNAMTDAITLVETGGYSISDIERAVVKVRGELDAPKSGYTKAQREGGHGALNQLLRSL